MAERSRGGEERGSRVERLVFEHRALVLAACGLVTAALGWSAATRYAVNADFDGMVPSDHPFIRTYAEHRNELRGLGNALHVVLERRTGDIWDREYQEALRDLTDELILLPGADRAWVRSLWTPSVRWNEVTGDGLRGGPVVPEDYDGSPPALAALRRNVARAGVDGALVGTDQRSSLVFVPLLDRDPVDGHGISYQAVARELEAVRERLERRSAGAYTVRVVGFAQLVADLLAGMRLVAVWFGIAAAVAAAAVFLYTRCARSTAVVVGCSALAVVWQLGIVCALGLRLDPFSMLVPFLVFALGISHGTQKMNGVAQDIARGAHRVVAARRTFRRLFLAGLAAVLTDAVGFAALGVIAVPAIRQMAATATIGACVLVFTNLVLVPVLLSYTGVRVRPERSAAGARGSAGRVNAWKALSLLVDRRWATGALVVVAVVLAAATFVVRRGGGRGVERGASELAVSSRYNRDAAYLASHYDVSADVFAVIVKTAADGCLDHRTLVEADRLAWALQQLPAVRTTVSLPDAVRRVTAESFEGDPRWHTLSRDQHVLNHAVQQAMARDPRLANAECSIVPVVAHLSDHGRSSVDSVVAVSQAFAGHHTERGREFLLAAGNTAMLAATRMEVRSSRWIVAACVYAAVVLLCLLVFRSWRAVAIAVAPIVATSVACEALMVLLGVELELTTLPVISLGVGIPDFALYLLTIQLAQERAGAGLHEAYRRALQFTGRAVVLVAVTLAASVVTWAWSPIRLQADMGILLAFMFLGNMVAALTLVPALSSFLLRDDHASSVAAEPQWEP